MAGNVEEWVSTTTTDGHGIFKGGYFMHVTVNGLGCHMSTTAHAQWYHDYSLSFRCCADPTEPGATTSSGGDTDPSATAAGVDNSLSEATAAAALEAAEETAVVAPCPTGTSTVLHTLAACTFTR